MHVPNVHNACWLCTCYTQNDMYANELIEQKFKPALLEKNAGINTIVLPLIKMTFSREKPVFVFLRFFILLHSRFIYLLKFI